MVVQEETKFYPLHQQLINLKPQMDSMLEDITMEIQFNQIIGITICRLLENGIIWYVLEYSTLLKIKEVQNHCNFVLRTKKNDDNDPPKRN